MPAYAKEPAVVVLAAATTAAVAGAAALERVPMVGLAVVVAAAVLRSLRRPPFEYEIEAAAGKQARAARL